MDQKKKGLEGEVFKGKPFLPFTKALALRIYRKIPKRGVDYFPLSTILSTEGKTLPSMMRNKLDSGEWGF